jgi:hypothetical protein
MQEHNRQRGARLRRFQLSAEEWNILQELSPLLEVSTSYFYLITTIPTIVQVFLVATKKISQSRTPLIHEVIPIFDIITGAMDEFIDNTRCPLVIRTAALRGLTMMNKYYALTDESVVFRIAMSMTCLC